MKKLMTMIMAIMFSIAVYSQNIQSEKFTNQLIEITAGIITESAPNEGDSYHIITLVPEYIGIDLIQAGFAVTKSSNESVLVFKNWTIIVKIEDIVLFIH